MAISSKLERKVLSQDEFEAVRATHHPAIYELDRKELQAVRVRLREMRGKARTIARQKSREGRGKAEGRGKSFPGTAEQPLRRKQILAAALKRVNKEIVRYDALASRAEHIDAARRALALKRSANFYSPPNDKTAGEGMQPIDNPRRRTKVHPSKVGRVSQATKVKQAIKDARV